MIKKIRHGGFIVALICVAAVSAAICAVAIVGSRGKIDFNADYYYVCYRITDNGFSASSISGAVSSYGGAGYILDYDGNFYVTVSCYYNLKDAETVCDNLKRRELDCAVLRASVTSYTVKGYSAKNNSELYLGNLNTLNSISVMAYECANGLDTGITQDKAKQLVASIKSGLNGLLKANGDNCFTKQLKTLLAECAARENGYLLSKDMRYLQIAVTDVILKAELY